MAETLPDTKPFPAVGDQPPGANWWEVGPDSPARPHLVVVPDLGPIPGAEANPAAPPAPGSAEAATASFPAIPVEAGPAALKDAETRKQDEAMLRRSHLVRRKIHEGGNQSIKGLHFVKSEILNALDSPGKAMRQFMYNRAKNGYARKVARHNAAIRDHASLRTQRTFGAKVNRAEAKMNRRGDKLTNHTDRMEARTTAVGESALRRQDAHIDKMKAKRENALARRAVRRQLRAEKVRPWERREIKSQIPHKQLERIGKVAIESEASHRLREKAESMEERAKKRQRRSEGRLNRVGERKRAYDENVDEADRSIAELDETRLPEARERVKQLRTELHELDADDTEGKARVTTALEEAEGQVNANVESLAEWRKKAGANRKKSAHATRRHTGLNRVNAQRLSVAQSAEGEVKLRRAVEHLDNVDLDHEVTVVLNSDEKRKAA